MLLLLLRIREGKHFLNVKKKYAIVSAGLGFTLLVSFDVYHKETKTRVKPERLLNVHFSIFFPQIK